MLYSELSALNTKTIEEFKKIAVVCNKILNLKEPPIFANQVLRSAMDIADNVNQAKNGLNETERLQFLNLALKACHTTEYFAALLNSPEVKMATFDINSIVYASKNIRTDIELMIKK